MRDKFIILVADDDADDQELIKQGLQKCKVPIEIVQVFGGAKVMDFMLFRNDYISNTRLPDLILLDLNMPLMDGFQVLHEIKRYPHFRKIPIYVVTTSRRIHDREKAIDLGATGFYSKGSRSSDLQEIMHDLCRECFENPGKTD